MSHAHRSVERVASAGRLAGLPLGWTLLLALVWGWPGALPAQEIAAVETPLVVFLVRHAEKVDDSADPPLSAAGRARAELLARLLGEAGVTHVHSTDFVRTRQTAAPLAGRLGLEVDIYDHRRLDLLAERLRGTPGRHLVVGHSNTTPEMVELLGGEPGPPIDEAEEYDRLYTLFVHDDGTSTVVTRFGEG